MDQAYEMLFREMLNGFAVHEIICDPQGRPVDYRFLGINPAFERMTGLGQEIIGRTVLEVLPDTEDYWIERYGRVALTGEPVQFESHSQALGKWFNVTAYQPWEGQFACIFEDVTERHAAQQELHESRDRFERMLAVVPDMILMQDPEMNVLYCNWQGFAAVPEERRVPGEKCYRVLRGLDDICPDCRARAVLRTGQAYQEEVDLPEGRRVDVRVIPVLDANGEVEMFMEWVRDTTDQRQAEEERRALQNQLLQAQKMESVGRLAGGVAHDFNNMLTVILGNAEAALGGMKKDSPLRELIEEIRQAGRRSADLTRQLLAFARKQTVAPQTLDVNKTVDGMLRMLRRLIGESIRLVWKPAPNLWSIRMDPGQIQQILANLCVNARDAIGDVGTVTIETANTHVAPGQPDTADGLAPGEYVQLTVSDDGCGMDAETRAGVFEPFFTTKGIGDGTGLGLATVYGIVHQNEGSISVSSEPGEGSTFTILLPRHTGQTTVTDEDQAGQHVGGTETVLLVEDEDAILRLASALLQRLGYRVITAVSPSDALREAQTHCGEIDLLFTDVVMPGMNGHDLYRQLREICPDLQCLFASGFAADAMAEHGMLADDVHFIQKPYSISALAEGLRNALRS